MPPRVNKAAKLTSKDIQEAKKNNPPEIRVVELGLKKADFYCDQSLIAGYLRDCPNTETLRSIIASLQPLFEEYVTFRTNCWTSAPVPKPTDAGNPIASHLFTFLSQIGNNHVAAKFLNDASTEPHPQKVGQIFTLVDLCTRE